MTAIPSAVSKKPVRKPRKPIGLRVVPQDRMAIPAAPPVKVVVAPAVIRLTAGQLEAAINLAKPTDWFTAEDLNLPAGTHLGGAKNTMATLFRRKQLERSTRTVGVKVEYVYRVAKVSS